MAQQAFAGISVANLDRYARLVRDTVNVPMAMIGIVEDDRLVLPGAAGLPAEVQARRSVALADSYCRYVVKDSLPLVVDDARVDERLPDDPVAGDLGVIAYAGFPLTDGDGHVVGALCALDFIPRAWGDDELARLDDLAHLCSREIVLDTVTRQAAEAHQLARDVSARAQLLLEVSELLSDTLTKDDVGSALSRAAARGLGCRHAGAWVQTERNKSVLHRVPDPLVAWEWAERHARIPLTHDHAINRVYRSGTALYLPDHDSLRVGRRDHDVAAGIGAAALVPLVVSGETIGVLVLAWDAANPFADHDRDTIAALALYAAQAAYRASLLDERVGAASTMQQALLSALPAVPGLELGARYRAVAMNDHVGGDWYDATVLADDSVTLMVGDVVGHDIRAAAAMGQLRSMLRAFGWALDDPPSRNVARLDRAARDLSVARLATLVYARLELPDPRTGRRCLRWTNAGHLPPVLVDSTGHARALTDGRRADMMLGVLPDTERRDQETELEPGDTVVFFTDGLVERRDEAIDAGITRLLETLERYHTRPVEELLDSVLAELAGVSHADDVALLAVRVA